MTNKTTAEIDELHKILEDNLSKEVIDKWGGTFEKLMKNYHQSRLNAIAKEVEGKCLYQGINPNEAQGVREVLKIINKHTE